MLFILSVFLLTACVAVSLLVFQHRRTVYPDPENESAFLKNYAPQSVAEPFDSHQFNSQWSHHRSDAAGESFATHRGEFQGKFAIHQEQWVPLMTALSADVSAQLSREGAQILAQTGDPRDGFHFDYILGKSYGALTISPLETYKNSQCREGTVAVVVNIALVEEWFPKEVGVIKVKFNNDEPSPSH